LDWTLGHGKHRTNSLSSDALALPNPSDQAELKQNRTATKGRRYVEREIGVRRDRWRSKGMEKKSKLEDRDGNGG
jgi:hypothetical protein